MATINGGSGSDVLNGTGGRDTMAGGDGNDTLRGGAGSDTLNGDAGNDILDGGTGDDTMAGGTGNDTYLVDSAGDVVLESDGAGVDLVKAYVDYSLGAYLENLWLMGLGALDGRGNALANSIRGNDAANLLAGMEGADQLDAAGGDDRLLGGAGNDWLKGGFGADGFVFTVADIAGGSATDQIADLSFAAGDTIELWGFREGGPRILTSYASLVRLTDVDPTVTVTKRNESGQIDVLVAGAGGATQTITVTDAGGSAWAAFTAAGVRPVAGADSATTDERTNVTIAALANNSGPELTLTGAYAPSGQGDVTISGDQLIFSPGSAFAYLTAGESAQVTLTYTIATAAGRTTTGTVAVTVNGLDDPAEIAGQTTGEVWEGGSALTGGALTIVDPDHDQAAFGPATVAGTYGSLTINAAGEWQYTLDEDAPSLAALNGGEAAPERIVVRAEDGTTRTIEITVHGSDEVIALPTAFAGTADPNDNDGVTGGGVLYSTVSNGALAGANTLYGTAGADAIDARNGNDVVYGWAGDDTISGGQGVDAIYGGSGDDAIDGNQAQDALYGGSGSDTIRGIQGDDRIVGGYGADTLTGNDGADTFVFLDARDTNDLIIDFLPGTDRLDFSTFLVGASQYHFTGPVEATHFSAGHTLIWRSDGATTTILGDTDGDFSTAEFMLTIQGSPPITAADFIL